MFRLAAFPQRIGLGLAVIVICLLLAFLPASPLDEDQRGFAAGMAAGMAVAMLAFGALWLVPAWRRHVREKMSDPVLMAQQRRYNRDFMPPMVAYVAVMLVWKPLLARIDATWLRFAIALLPVVFLVLVIRAMARYVRGCDELQRRMELEAVAISAAVVSALFMALGFLQSAKLIAIPAEVAMLWVFPALCLSYGATKLVIARRYS